MRPIIFGVLLLIALAAFFYTISRFVRFIAKGRKVTHTFDEKGARFGDLILYFLFQRSVAREPASLHHLLIFWGFLIICCGSLELMVQGFYQPFSYAMIVGHTLDQLFKLTLDLTNGVVLVIMLYSYFRRIVLRPPLIPLSGDAALILGMISLLCITHFIMHGAGMVATGTMASHGYMPVSAATAGLLSKLAPTTATTIAEANYWVHMIIILFFLNYIPYSKHIHLIGAFFNIALRTAGRRASCPSSTSRTSRSGVCRNTSGSTGSRCSTTAPAPSARGARTTARRTPPASRSARCTSSTTCATR
jgi:hypothetical protein